MHIALFGSIGRASTGPADAIRRLKAQN